MGFDRKLALYSTVVSARQRLLSKKRWYTIVTVVAAFYFSLKALMVYVWPPKVRNSTLLLYTLFSVPNLILTTTAMMSWFLLKNLERRFETLNDIVFNHLPTGLIAMPGQWTHSEIAVLLESWRLLHAELSDLVKIFSVGYGPLLLTFFVFGFVDIIWNIIYNHGIVKVNVRIENILDTVWQRYILYSVIVSVVVSMVAISVVASSITDKVTNGESDDSKTNVK